MQSIIVGSEWDLDSRLDFYHAPLSFLFPFLPSQYGTRPISTSCKVSHLTCIKRKISTRYAAPIDSEMLAFQHAKLHLFDLADEYQNKTTLSSADDSNITAYHPDAVAQELKDYMVCKGEQGIVLL